MTPDEQIKAIAEKHAEKIYKISGMILRGEIDGPTETEPNLWIQGITSALTEATQPLQKELDEANKEKETARLMWGQIASERDQLKQQLAEAVKDKERLLWALRHPERFRDISWDYYDSSDDLNKCLTVIDAAMNNLTKEGEG